MSDVKKQLELLNLINSIDNSIERLNDKIENRKSFNNDSISISDGVYLTMHPKLCNDQKIEEAVCNLIDAYQEGLERIRAEAKEEYLTAVVRNSAL